MKVLLLMIVTVRCKAFFEESYPYLWQKAYVPKSTVESNIINTFEFSFKPKCALQAEKNNRNLFCILDGKCLLTRIMVIPRNSSDGIDRPVDCWTALTDKDCMLDSGSAIRNGEETKHYCEKSFCVDGVLTKPPIQPSPSPQTTCPRDFTNVESLGCIKYVEEKITWCEARKKCLSSGADLLTVNEKSVALARKYLVEIGAENEQVWVGLHRIEAQWQFILGGALLDNGSEIWRSGEPNSDPALYACSRLYDDEVADKPCHVDTYTFFCQVPLGKSSTTEDGETPPNF